MMLAMLPLTLMPFGNIPASVTTLAAESLIFSALGFNNVRLLQNATGNRHAGSARSRFLQGSNAELQLGLERCTSTKKPRKVQ